MSNLFPDPTHIHLDVIKKNQCFTYLFILICIYCSKLENIVHGLTVDYLNEISNNQIKACILYKLDKSLKRTRKSGFDQGGGGWTYLSFPEDGGIALLLLTSGAAPPWFTEPACLQFPQPLPSGPRFLVPK